MSLFPYAGETSYTVQDSARNRSFAVTSPTPAVFPTNTAVVSNATEPGYTAPLRQVVTHYFTGCDMPLLSDDELRAHLGPDYPSVNEPGVDEYGTPLAISQRREDLLKAAVRVNLDLSDQEARLEIHRADAATRALATFLAYLAFQWLLLSRVPIATGARPISPRLLLAVVAAGLAALLAAALPTSDVFLVVRSLAVLVTIACRTRRSLSGFTRLLSP